MILAIRHVITLLVAVFALAIMSAGSGHGPGTAEKILQPGGGGSVLVVND